MAHHISLKAQLEESHEQDAEYVTAPFYFDGEPLRSSSETHARWGMTLLKAGTMRFRWNETNASREKTLRKIMAGLKSGLKSVPVELIHSKTIVEAETESDTEQIRADGIITRNCLLAPTVTVADCVPVFLYDRETKARGAFHSGWRGTGIAGAGVEMMAARYGSKPENIAAAVGAHIGGCCYFVDEERADYFAANFGGRCVEKAENHAGAKTAESFARFPYRLSLTEANLFALRKAGVKEENIVIADDCTCCSTFTGGGNIFGSFRRQAAFLPAEVDAETRSRSMCVQAAFVYMA